MRVVKIAGYVVGALLALLLVVIALVALFFNPNDYKDDIQRLVQEQTGRQFTLQGDLSLSVFPWLAVELGPVQLGDAPGFGDQPFASIEQARLGLRLLPLLRGRVEIGDVVLDSPSIRLVTDEQGRNNWADLGRQSGEQAPAEAATGSPMSATVAGLQIRNGTLVYEDRKQNTRSAVRALALKTGRLQSGEPFDLQLRLTAEQGTGLAAEVELDAVVTADLEQNIHRLGEPVLKVALKGAGYPPDGIPVEIKADLVNADVAHERYGVTALNADIRWQGEGYPKEGIPVSLRAQTLEADLAAQTLQVAGLEGDIAGARVTATLSGTEILDAPDLKGRLILAPVSLRELLPRFGIEVPVTRDAEVLKRFSLEADLAATKSSVDFSGLLLKLDDTTARGSLGIADFEAQALRFDLDVDRIDADRYLPPPVEAPKGQPADDAPTPIPVDALRDLNLRGQLQVGEAVFAGIRFSKLRLGVNARDGKLRLNPSEAAMYGGQYRGDINVDATGEVARVSLDEHVSGVDFAPLFRDFLETDRVSGRGSANLRLTGSGRDTDALLGTLDGSIDFNVTDGALEGADLWYEIRRARALLRQQAVPERTGAARTPFDSFRGTAAVRSGVLTNNDLDVSAQYLKVAGKGTVDLPKSELDYTLDVKVLKLPAEGADTTQMQELVDARIPVRVTGALTDPKVRPDIEGYIKGKAQQEIDKQKDKLEEKLKDRLKGILGGG